jgi:hypothetical protein
MATLGDITVGLKLDDETKAWMAEMFVLIERAGKIAPPGPLINRFMDAIEILDDRIMALEEAKGEPFGTAIGPSGPAGEPGDP